MGFGPCDDGFETTQGLLASRKAWRSKIAGMIRLIALVVLLWSANPAQAEGCRVADPELQGFYEGGCRKGLAHGRGHARGSAEYVGEFRRGLKHGRGVKTWPWGDRYEGEFFEDRKHGRGMYAWGAGSPWAGERYVGEFAADRREGFGTYFWPNGDRFEGLWKDDLRYGLTAMEQRREQAFRARTAAFSQTGAQVCRSVPVGVAEEAAVRGRIVALDNGRLTVELTEVAATPSGALPAFAAGSRISDDLWAWWPCL